MDGYHQKKDGIWKLFEQIDMGSNVSLAVNTEENKVLRLEDSTGDGIMTIYQVFDGVFLMYNDFHLRECASGFQGAETILAIDHCREGRIEQVNELGQVYYMEPGNLRIDRRVHHAGHVSFPLCHYHGITIGFELGAAQVSLKNAIEGIAIDLEALAERYCPQEKAAIIQGNPAIEALFYQLYHFPGNARLEYFKVKVIELLLYLNGLEEADMRLEKPYFYSSQIRKVKAIHELITTNMAENYTLDELSERFEIPLTSMKRCFKSIYGNSIHAYLKEYRIHQAALLLKMKWDMSVFEIALAVGYTSPGKFSAAFKEAMGKTPMEYRESSKVGELDYKK
ncbi:MAG: AraC family transcriptional regulator [Bacteroidales bacterium]|nr:AraC family transcriptional regulator [Clostridium sp.]MCM1202973.1 AraC family transcriptional regulator [Bacteroidales bacterium]